MLSPLCASLAVLATVVAQATAAPAAAAVASSAATAAAPAAAAAAAESMTILDYYFRGGFVMHFILGVSIIAFAVSMERLYNFRRAETDHRKLLADVKDLLADDLVYKAMARCDEDRGPVAHVLKAVLKNVNRDSDTIRDAIDQSGLEEIPRLERRMHMLGVLPNIATLLGLLGTILGMIQTFADIAHSTTGVVNVHLLADGIWTAMLTTFFGLAVAIPATIAHAWLTGRVRGFAVAMEHSAAELVHFLEHRPRRDGDEV